MINIKKVAEELGFITSDEEIKPGDTYLAQRNGPPDLLTCRDFGDGFIIPEELAYCYDTWECIKIIGTFEKKEQE
jgi:hypothetical protein